MKKNTTVQVNYPLEFDTAKGSKQEEERDNLKVISKNSVFANVKRASKLVRKHGLLEFFGS